MTELTRYQMYINGEWVDAENGATFTSVNPATGQTWAEVPEASEADINRAVEAAQGKVREVLGDDAPRDEDEDAAPGGPGDR